MIYVGSVHETTGLFITHNYGLNHLAVRVEYRAHE